MEEAVSMYRQAFTNAQEKALIQVMNWLIDHNVPPITAIIKNLVEEIRGAFVGKN